jgi:hypothetical protein
VTIRGQRQYLWRAVDQDARSSTSCSSPAGIATPPRGSFASCSSGAAVSPPPRHRSLRELLRRAPRHHAVRGSRHHPLRQQPGQAAGFVHQRQKVRSSPGPTWTRARGRRHFLLHVDRMEAETASGPERRARRRGGRVRL